MTALRRYQPGPIAAEPLVPTARVWPVSLVERLVTEPLVAGMDGATDLYETEREIVVQTLLPGFRAEEIEVFEQHGVVTIRAARSTEQRDRHGSLRIAARQAQVVERSFRLPAEVDPARAEATLRHGVLTIRLPKMRVSAARRIPIRSRGQRIRVGRQAGGWLRRLSGLLRRPRLRLARQA